MWAAVSHYLALALQQAVHTSTPHASSERRYADLVPPPQHQVLNSPPNRGNSNGTSPQASASFNISGSGTLEGSLQVGTPSLSYGTYLQLPTVTTSASPPPTDCTSSVAGRLVVQYDATKLRTTLWSCSSAGVWTRLAQGG